MNIYSLFLILNIFAQEGRIHIINDNIFVIADHKVIKEKINEHIRIKEDMQITGRLYPYYPDNNKKYLKILKERLGSKVKVYVKLFYINFKLILLEITT